MVGFFNLTTNTARQIDTGKAIIRVSKSVNQNTPTSEWKKFTDNPHQWLFDHNYRYDDPTLPPGTVQSGRVPATIRLVPVYDTADTMHIRIPFSGLMDRPPVVEDELPYGLPNIVGQPPNPDKFPILLARYFMRHCR